MSQDTLFNDGLDLVIFDLALSDKDWQFSKQNSNHHDDDGVVYLLIGGALPIV